MKKIIRDERGMSHVLMVLLAVVVLGGVGYVGWTVMNKSENTSNSKAVKSALKSAEKECTKNMDDKDLCKFLTSWAETKKFSVATVGNEAEGSLIMKVDGDNTYMKMTGVFAMEVTSIGDTTYTKAGETWWKETKKETTDETSEASVSKDDFAFEAPKEGAAEGEGIKYEKIGKEACGKHTCFKYKVIEPGVEGTQHIWFDDDDYLIRKISVTDADGTASEMIVSYDDVSVKAPSPVKELGENQYIMPGATEPTTL